MKIDLTSLVDPKQMYKCLAGKEAGRAARAAFDIDAADQAGEKILVSCKSKDVTFTVVTPQFLDGLFRGSLEHHGSIESFLEFYTFSDPTFAKRVRSHLDYVWQRTSHGLPVRIASEELALATKMKTYPVERHPWMAGWINWQQNEISELCAGFAHIKERTK